MFTLALLTLLAASLTTARPAPQEPDHRPAPPLLGPAQCYDNGSPSSPGTKDHPSDFFLSSCNALFAAIRARKDWNENPSDDIYGGRRDWPSVNANLPWFWEPQPKREKCLIKLIAPVEKGVGQVGILPFALDDVIRAAEKVVSPEGCPAVGGRIHGGVVGIGGMIYGDGKSKDEFVVEVTRFQEGVAGFVDDRNSLVANGTLPTLHREVGTVGLP